MNGLEGSGMRHRREAPGLVHAPGREVLESGRAKGGECWVLPARGRSEP